MLSFSADDESLSFRPHPSPSAREAEVAADPGEFEIRDEELPAEKNNGPVWSEGHRFESCEQFHDTKLSDCFHST